MKVLIDTDTLADFITNADTNLFDTDNFRKKSQFKNLSFWVAAHSVYEVASTCDLERVNDCINLVADNFSVIPLRSSTFCNLSIAPDIDFETRLLIAEAENYSADQEASRIRKLYAAYLDGIKGLQEALGRSDGSTDVALLKFLAQQKWATAYEKNQVGQHTFVIQNTEAAPSLALPPVVERQTSEENEKAAEKR